MAAVASGILSIAACWFFGMVLPTWMVGKDSPTSPDTGQVFSVMLSFASAYSLFAFILLTVYFYRRFSAAARPQKS